MISLIAKKFYTLNYERLNKKELLFLNKTAKDLFYFINEFGKVHNTREEIIVYFIDDQLQQTETDTYGIFQLYFYEKSFALDYNITTINDTKLTKRHHLEIVKRNI